MLTFNLKKYGLTKSKTAKRHTNIENISHIGEIGLKIAKPVYDIEFELIEDGE